MNFPFYIARRYLFSKSKKSAINIITAIASVGIIAGTMALFVVLSVFSGLREFSLSFSNEFDSDLKIFPSYGKVVSISPNQEQKITEIQGIQSFSKVTEERVLFFFNGKEIVTNLKGVDSTFIKTNNITQNLFNGQWLSPNSVEVVIGYGISEKLSLGLFDFNNPFEVFVPRKGKAVIQSETDAFKKAKLIPVGIYALSEDLDTKYVFCDLALSQYLLEYKPNEVSSIEIDLTDEASEEQVIQQLQNIFGNKVIFKNRMQQNETLYRMLNTENIAVYLIFTLVIIIALFNLVGALIMMILDKKDNLKTMVSLGAEVTDLRKIFFYQGTLISIIGGFIGLLLGIGVVVLQKQFNWIMITESLPYPVVFNYTNCLIVVITILTLGMISSALASSRISRKIIR